MSPLAQSLVNFLTVDALVAAAFGVLWRQDRERYLGLWALGYVALGASYGAKLLLTLGLGPPTVLYAAYGLLVPVTTLVVAAAALAVLGRRLHLGWYLLGAAAAAWFVVGGLAGLRPIVVRLPPDVAVCLTTFYVGVVFLRHGGRSAAARVTGISLCIVSLHVVDHAFLVDVPWFAPWGFWVAALGVVVAGLGVLVLHLDRGRARLAESEVRYRSLFENALEGIFLATPAWRLTEVSPAFLRLVGAPAPAAVVGLDVRETLFLDAGDVARVTARLEAGDVATGEEVGWRRLDGGALDVSLDLRRVRDARGEVTHLQGLVRDVTDRRRLEEALRQAQKMEALGRVAGGVAHDFNNLLTVILGNTDLLDRRLEAGDASRPVVAQIAGAAERAAALTGQLLAFSRRQVLRPQVVDLGRAVADGADMLRRLIGEDISLVVDPGDTPLRIRADPVQLEQVVLNLAINARDAMPEGGTLTLEVRRAPGNGAPKACLEVRDTGRGMDPATLDHVFEPFYTTKEAGRGTGLGLATVYGIVTQSGGEIGVESHEGRGSTFRITLPLADETGEPRPERAPPPATGAAPPRATVLLAEDDEGVRRLVQEVLEEAGYQVLAAADGEAALALAAAGQRAVDLLVTDVVMPGMRGPDLADRLAAAGADVPVLLMSGYADEDLEVAGTGRAFLAKPFTPDALLAAAEAALGDGTRAKVASRSDSWSHGEGSAPEDR